MLLRLWLVRHAKSDWEQGVRDFDRGLNARGHRDGPFMAAWLSRQPQGAGWIWSSTANRALTTARYLATGWQLPEDRLVAVDSLYHAPPMQALDVIRETPADVTCAAVVFHNPGITELVNLLAGRGIIDNVPTLGIAEFTTTLSRTDRSWADTHLGSWRLERIVSPKALRAGHDPH